MSSRSYLEETVISRFEAMAEKYPRNTAVVFLGEKFSYLELNRLARRFAAGLSHQGVKPGDRVVIYISNCIQWVVAFLGIQKIGAVVMPVSPIYTSHEIEYMIKDAGAETIICHDTNFGYVKEILPNTPLKRVIVTNLAELLPAWKRVIGTLFDKIPGGKVERGSQIFSFKDLLKISSDPPPVKIDPRHDLAYILYTGGTTGFPKGVPGNHQGMTSYIQDIMEDVIQGHVREGADTYIAVNPLFHIMALGFFMAVGLNQGNTTILMPVPQVDAILADIRRFQIRWFLGVPTLYRMILENDRLGRYDLRSLKYCYCGGDMLPLEVHHRWKEIVGQPIYQVYGSTEVGHITYSRLDREPDPQSIGTPAPVQAMPGSGPGNPGAGPDRGGGGIAGHLRVHPQAILEQAGRDRQGLYPRSTGRCITGWAILSAEPNRAIWSMWNEWRTSSNLKAIGFPPRRSRLFCRITPRSSAPAR